MWIREFSKVYAGLSKEQAWQWWTDVNNWHKWHADLDYCKLEGDFAVGNNFILKPKGVKPVKILLTEIDLGKSFTDCTTFFGAKMYDKHIIEETAAGLKLTNILSVSGPLKWLWIKLVAQNVAATVAKDMDRLANLARTNNG